jgi:hypothetical protein
MGFSKKAQVLAYTRGQGNSLNDIQRLNLHSLHFTKMHRAFFPMLFLPKLWEPSGGFVTNRHTNFDPISLNMSNQKFVRPTEAAKLVIVDQFP